MQVTYISVWDGGIEVCSEAEYDPETRTVTEVETVDLEYEVDILEREFIILPDGSELDRLDEYEEYEEDELLNLFTMSC